jgi:hypothetical protein
VVIVAALLGGYGAVWLARTPDRLIASVALAWMVFLAGGLAAFPRVARAITPWPLVEAIHRELRPGDALMQFGHFVQVVPYYTKRLTPICDLHWTELDFGRARPHAPGLFPSREEMAALWKSERRVLVVTYRTRLVSWRPRELDLGVPHVLASARNGKLYLLANQ